MASSSSQPCFWVLGYLPVDDQGIAAHLPRWGSGSEVGTSGRGLVEKLLTKAGDVQGPVSSRTTNKRRVHEDGVLQS